MRRTDEARHVYTRQLYNPATHFTRVGVYLNPDTGRFNRLDTFGGSSSDPQSLHKYAYAQADPVNEVDPTGLFGVLQVLSAISIGTTVASLGFKAYSAGVGAYKLLDLTEIMQELAKLERIGEVDLIDVLLMRNEIVLAANELIADIANQLLSLAQEALTEFAFGAIFIGVVGMAGLALEGGEVTYQAGKVTMRLADRIESHHTVFKCAVKPFRSQRLYRLKHSQCRGAKRLALSATP